MMDGWPTGLFVETIMSVHQKVLSVDNSIERHDGYVGIILSVRRQFHVRWNHHVCLSTIPRVNVTCDGERELGTYVGISVLDTQTHGRTDRDQNKGFRALGGNPPKEI